MKFLPAAATTAVLYAATFGSLVVPHVSAQPADQRGDGRGRGPNSDPDPEPAPSPSPPGTGATFVDPSTGSTVTFDGDDDNPTAPTIGTGSTGSGGSGGATVTTDDADDDGPEASSVPALPEPLEANGWPNPKEVTQFAEGKVITYQGEAGDTPTAPSSGGAEGEDGTAGAGPGNSGTKGGNSGNSSGSAGKRVIDVGPASSILDAVNAIRSGGGKSDDDEIKLTGLTFPPGRSNGPSAKPQTRDVNVRLTDAFGTDTTYSTPHDSPGTVHPYATSRSVLVSTAEETGATMVLTVGQDGTVKGVAVTPDGTISTVHQEPGGETTLVEAPEFATPAFTCDEADEQGRRLDAHLHDHDRSDHHDHDHHDHDHHDHDDHPHGRHHHGGGDDVTKMWSREAASLRGARSDQARRLYYTDSYPKKYTYQVDMYVDIDQEFVNKAGGGNLQDAIDYVNLLVSATNVVYEREVDTHIHVAHVNLTDIYDGTGSTSQALSVLRDTHNNENFASGAGLYHAILGRNLGGGIAYVGAVCSSSYGFGVSANMKGTFNSTDAATVWDTYVLMHEVGHNFGTGHTHSYDPDVDQCGDGVCGNVAAGKATVMSYCHQCTGGVSNIAYTMGGARDEAGVWQNSPLTEGFSVDAKRVAKKMYDHVSTQSCTAAPANRPNQGTSAPTSSPKPSLSAYPTAVPSVPPTPAPTTSSQPSGSPTVSPAPSASPSGAPTFAPTAEARLRLNQTEYDHFQIVPGFMFDVVAKENIIIHNMEYLMYTGTPVTLDIFTTDGSFLPVVRSEANWTQIASVPNLHADGCLDNDRLLPRHSFAPIRIEAGRTVGFYFRILETANQRLALDNTGSSPDGTYVQFLGNNDLAVTSGVFKDGWDHHSGTAYNSYRYTGEIHYTIDGTRQPTDVPTPTPSASSPTFRPTGAPTTSPTATKLVLGPPPATSSTLGTYGHMWDVQATAGGAGLLVTSMEYVLMDEGPPVTLEIYTKEGPHEPAHADASQWTLIGTVANAWGDGSWPDHGPARLPAGSFAPQAVPAGTTRAFYVRIRDPDTANNYLLLDNTNGYGTPYFSDANGVVLQGRKKSSSGWDYTSTVASGWMGNLFYEELGTQSPTTSPTRTPTTSPTRTPTFNPTTTMAPVGTTENPTKAPTAVPTVGPTLSPSVSPTPGTHVLSVPPTGNYLINGYFFDVVAGNTPVLVTDLHITTPYNGRIKVYTHLGTAQGTHTDPPQWGEPIADTVTNQKTGYSPGALDWNFEPVAVPANGTRAFYVKSSSYLYGQWKSSSLRWTKYVENADEPALALMYGRGGGSTDFTTNGDYSMYGSILYQDLGPTLEPTSYPTNYPTLSPRPSISQAPSTVYTAGSIEGSKCSSCYSSYGNMFELLALRDMQITGLGIHMSQSSAKQVQVFCRHEPFYTGGNHNNFTGGWELIQDTSSYSAKGRGALTSLPDFDNPINLNAGDKISLQVSFVKGNYMYYYKGAGYGNYNAGFSDNVAEENLDIVMYEAGRVSDYYGGNVNSAGSLSLYYVYKFEGAIRYQVRNNGVIIESPTAQAAATTAGTMTAEEAPPDGFVEPLDGGDDINEEPILVGDGCGQVGDICFNSEGCCDLLYCLGNGKCGFPTSVGGDGPSF